MDCSYEAFVAFRGSLLAPVVTGDLTFQSLSLPTAAY